MPLNLKEIDGALPKGGHHILYTVTLATWRDGKWCQLCYFSRDECDAQSVHAYLVRHFEKHWSSIMWSDIVFRKEICVLDGSVLHSLSGRRYPVEDVERSFASSADFRPFEGAPPGDWTLKMFGEKRKLMRPKRERFLMYICWCQ